MENASNALIIAASILISIMIISLGTYLFTTFGNYNKEINQNISLKDKQEFNAKFTKYQTSSSDEQCTAYDIVTIINLAKDNNEKFDYSTSSRKMKDGSEIEKGYSSAENTYIYVSIDKYPQINETSQTKALNDFLDPNNTNNGAVFSNGSEVTKYNYNCVVNISNSTGLVKSIVFIKKN